MMMKVQKPTIKSSDPPKSTTLSTGGAKHGAPMLSHLIRFTLVIQIIFSVIFITEFTGQVYGIHFLNLSWKWHEAIELSAILSLIIGMGVAIYTLRKTLNRNQRVEDQLLLATGEFETLIKIRFKQWGLSRAEKEVAHLAIKGFSITEIAELRGKSEGTIKAQNAAIYRKAGVNGRTQLLVSFVEDMIDRTVEEKAL